MTIRVLTFEGCPHADAAARLVRQIVAELSLEATVEEVQIHDTEEAEAQYFLGSPTIQVDGRDIEASRRGDMPCFGCRLYAHHGAPASGVPSREMLLAGIREVQRHSGPH